MITIGIVILHYKNISETYKCIESYKKQNMDGISAKIVVVDNGSCNGTGEELHAHFANDVDISIIILEKNLGFAKGNNTGFQFLNERFSPDFIIYSNSDIELPDNNFYQWIVQKYNLYHFAVLGPDIYSLTKKYHQSPCENTTLLRCLIKRYMNFRIMKKLLRLTEHAISWQEPSAQFTLHGALLIFSKDFFHAYPNGIYDKTFLYCEEAFLRHYCNNAHLLMIYDNTYTAYHVQAASSQHTKQTKFRRQQEKKSLDLLIQCFLNRQQTTDNRQQTTDNRQQTTDNRQQTTDNRIVSTL